MPSLFVVSTSRGKIAASLELDVVVDDRPENCLDIAIDSKARAILIWRGDQNAVPASARTLGIGGVTTVAACLDLLVAADSPDAGQTRSSIVCKAAARAEVRRAAARAWPDPSASSPARNSLVPQNRNPRPTEL